jgi:hypothetical protein
MAAGNTYEAIATQTLGTAAATVTFSSIPSTYTDLVLISSPANNTSESLYFRINGDTGSSYSTTYMTGNGTAASSARQASNTTGILAGAPNVGLSSTVYGTSIIQVMNYSNATTYKTALCRWGLASAETNATVGLWRSTAAITSVTLLVVSGTFSVGSTFSLYGIKAA